MFQLSSIIHRANPKCSGFKQRFLIFYDLRVVWAQWWFCSLRYWLRSCMRLWSDWSSSESGIPKITSFPWLAIGANWLACLRSPLCDISSIIRLDRLSYRMVVGFQEEAFQKDKLQHASKCLSSSAYITFDVISSARASFRAKPKVEVERDSVWEVGLLGSASTDDIVILASAFIQKCIELFPFLWYISTLLNNDKLGHPVCIDSRVDWTSSVAFLVWVEHCVGNCGKGRAR